MFLKCLYFQKSLYVHMISGKLGIVIFTSLFWFLMLFLIQYQ